jgi:AcrR family transcriptional regulator
MKKQPTIAEERQPRPKRADAQRKMGSLLKAATAVFAKSGVDAPVGTVYRHFPQRSDLIVAVFQSNVDACADAAPALAKEHPPITALSLWMERYVDFIGTKLGLSKALYSGDPAYKALPGYFSKRLRPALTTLLDAAVEVKAVRPGTDPDDLLVAVANLCSAGYGRDPQHARRMVKLLVDGLRYGAPK